MDFRLAAKGFVFNEGKILLIKRNKNDVHKPDIWEIPGGRLEIGEDPKIGVLREIEEETGLKSEIVAVLNVKHFVRDDGQTITSIIFLCESLGKEIILSEEHSKFEWVEIYNCREKLTNHYHSELDLIERFFRHLIR